MGDYWLTQDILRASGFGFIALSFLGIALALWLPKKWWGKLAALAMVVLLISIPVRQGVKEVGQDQVAADDYKERLAKAQALFAERCKTAGENIYRTVENVEGVLLTTLRPVDVSHASQHDRDDQYGYNVGGEEYIRYYLIGGSNSVDRYRFIEAPTDTGKYRFTTPLDAATSRQYWTKGGGVVPVVSTKVDTFTAKYAVEWKDISTKEDRDLWMAGGSLRITDRTTGEILGERIGYLLETGMGSTAGQRSPWSWARYYAKSCPSVNEHNRIFVEKVLKPVKGEKK